MTTLKKCMLIAASLLLFCSVSAKAHLILEGYFIDDRPATGEPGDELAWIADKLAIPAEDLSFLGRANGSGDNITDDPEYLFADGVVNIIDYFNTDVREAYLEWDLTGTGWELAAVFIKDGRWAGDTLYSVTPDQVLMSSAEQIVTLTPYETRGGISHISLFGTRGTSVPDGGVTLLMLGIGLLGVGALRRLSA